VAVVQLNIINIGVGTFERKIVKGGCFIDFKSKFDRETLSAAGFRVWRL